MVPLVFLQKGAFRPLRHEFPDDCEVVVGRATGDDPSVLGDGARFEVRLPCPALSERHATLAIAGGAVTLRDHGSRNGTFLRLDPEAPHPLGTSPVVLADAVTLHLDAGRWEVPARFDPPTPERLCAVLRARLEPRGAQVALGGDGAVAWRVVGDDRPLVVAPADRARTLATEDIAWARLVVNAYNSAADAARTRRPWRFTAVSPERQRALAQCQRAAPTSLPVLLLGPSGAGKDLLAQDLHDHGPRPDAPFVAVNCAELSPERLEAQLFGYARGAFTGAVADRAGLVEAAAGGTLFLDEVAEMPPEVQAKLLRFVESERGEYRRMGDPRARYARVRVVAATHRDITAEGSGFRRDLFFRLAGVVVAVPAPSPDDVAAIARALFARCAAEGAEVPAGAELARIAADASKRAWPGGARALRQCVERCVQMRDPARTWAANWSEACAPVAGSAPAPVAVEVPPATVARLVSEVLFLAGARAHRTRGELARRLGMTYQGVDQRLQAMGLSLDDLDGLARRHEEARAALRELAARSPGVAAALGDLSGA